MNFKSITLLCCLFLMGLQMTQAQELKFPDSDKSPMDAATYPRNAAWRNYLSGDDKNTPMKIRVHYSRPNMKGRVIFGDLVPFGKEWRLGANEATEVYFGVPVEIGGTMINPGYYTMFADVYPTQWVLKISSERHIAGGQNRDISMDVASVSLPVVHTAESREAFTIGFQEVDDNHCNMIMGWDRSEVSMPISFAPAFMAGDDASPMDLAQYPRNSRMRNFLEGAEKEAAMPKVRVVYSRPKKKGRNIFGELLKFGEPWRMGANETTEITFFENVKFGDKDIKAGRYGIMVVPNQDKWEFVVHTGIPSWGTFGHDPKNNIASVTVPVEKTGKEIESLSIFFQKKSDNLVHMIVAWDQTMAQVPITMK
ncbi:MAG: DUF2911 domain-containing protein [Bacteroidota bacterium]